MLSFCGFFYVDMYFSPPLEYLPLAKTLALGRPYALGTILLALVYQAMSKYVSDEPYHRVGSALWFVQTRLLAYFLELSSQDPTSFNAMCSLRTMPSNDLLIFFLGLENWALLHLFLKPDFVPILA